MSAAMGDVSPGQMLGNCRIIEQVGQGGMGTVYRAHQAALGRYVAVKVISPVLVGDPDALARFRREALAIASLRHPHILTVYDFGEQDGVAYLVTEFAAGGTLKARLGAAVNLPDTVALLRPIGSALDYAHVRGVVHRDIKPANVLLHEDGTLLLSDFGLARMTEATQGQLTSAGLLVGTPAYMAPEQGLGAPVGPAADLYALGVMAYELLTASVPFSGPTPLSVMLAHIQQPLPAACERNPELPKSIEGVLQRALAKQPADRFATAAELVQALENAGQDSDVSTPTVITARAVESASPPWPGTERRSMAADAGVTQVGEVKHARLESAPLAVRRRRLPTAAVGGVVVGLAVLLAAAALLRQFLVVQPRPEPTDGLVVVVVATDQSGATINVTLQPTAPPLANWQSIAGGRPGIDLGGFPAVAVDRQGFVYVALDDQHIQKLSPAGQRVGGPWGTQGGPVEFDELRGLAVDDAGNIYVTEWGKVNRVQKLAVLQPDWLQTIARWGTSGAVAGQFRSPAGAAVDRQGNVYVAERDNNRVQKLSPAGAPLAQWGARGTSAGQFNGPLGVAIDKQGNLYVADTANNRVQKLSPTGAPLAQWGKSGGGAGDFVAPGGVAVDADGNVYVADTGNNRIQKLSPAGQPLAQWGNNGTAIGEFDHPAGVAVDDGGNVYVADSGNHRLQKLVPTRS